MNTDRQHVLGRVSRETGERFNVYVDLLSRWQRAKNLVGPSTLEHVWSRHIADGLQLLDCVPRAGTWLDLGSGAGFPGLVVAIAGPPGTQVTLVESNSRKCAFLREVIRATAAPAKVIASRLEPVLAASDLRADYVSARALAPLSQLLAWCEPLWRKGVIGIFPKGQDVEAELTEASKSWMIQYDLIPSTTDPRAQIVRISSAARR